MRQGDNKSVMQFVRRLLSIFGAVTLAIIAGIATLELLEYFLSSLPRNKTWQIPTMILSAFVVSGFTGVTVLRMIWPRPSTGLPDQAMPSDNGDSNRRDRSSH